jgi:K+/H+ antiporter YhaU regulatory subunit KhtT
MNIDDLDGPASESTGTLDEAASAFEAILAGETADNPETPKKSNDEPEDEPEASETADDEGDDADEDGEEEGSDDEPEKKEDVSDEDKPVVTVEIDGKPIELTKAEIQSSYLRQADYTRKTQALAEERKQFQSVVQQAQEQEKVYSQLLPVMVERMQQYMPQPPRSELIDTDPVVYMKQKELYEREMGDFQAAQAEMQRMQSKGQAEQEQQLQAYVAQNAQMLPELIPEWKDAKNYDRDRNKLRDYLKGRNFSDQEIDQAYDARIVAIAYDAMRWRELKNSKPKQSEPLEKALKPSAPAVKPMNNQTKAKIDARKRLAKTGSIRDAAAVFESLI